MLSKSVLVAACAWFSHSIVQGQFGNGANCDVDETDVPEMQSGMNNFIIDMLGSLQFAYALEQCTATNVISTGKWYMYQCNDMDDTVTKTEYFDDQCATDGIIVETFNAANMTEGDRGHFECGGYNTYAKTIWSLDPDCIEGVTIYAALGACTNFGGTSQLNFYCSANETIGQIFSLRDMMPTSTFIPSSTFSFNATLASLLNSTLPTLFNATFPSLLNATLPSFLNATLLPSTTLLFNATFPILTTTQLPMMCADETYCHKWLFFPDQCRVLATIPTSGTDTILYGRMDECASSIESTTMIETTGNISATEPTPSSSTSTSTTGTGSTSTSTGILTSSTSSTSGVSTTESTSGAIRPSLLFTVGMLFSFFFLVSV